LVSTGQVDTATLPHLADAVGTRQGSHLRGRNERFRSRMHPHKRNGAVRASV